MEGLLPDTVLATVRGKQGQHGGGKATAKMNNCSSTKNEVASKSQVGAKGLSTSRSKQPNTSNSLANAQNNTKNKDGMKQSKGGAKVTPGMKPWESHIILSHPKVKSNNHKNESNKSQRNPTNSKPAKENLKHGKEHSKAGKENLRHLKGDAKQKPKQTFSKSGPTKQIKKVTFEPHPAAPLDDNLSWDYDESKVELRKKKDFAGFLAPAWLKEDSCLDPEQVIPNTSGVENYGVVSHFHGEDIHEKSEAVIVSSPAKTSYGEKGECRKFESVTASSEHTDTISVEPITNKYKFGSSEFSTLASELSVSSLVEPNAIVDGECPLIHGNRSAEPSSLNMESPDETSSNPPLGKTDHSPEGSTGNEFVHSPVTQKCTESTEKDAPEKEDLLVNEWEFVSHSPPGFCLGSEDSAKRDSNVTDADDRSISACYDNASSYLQSKAPTDNDACYMANKTNNLPAYDKLSIDPLNCDKEDISQHSDKESPEEFALYPSCTSSEVTAAEVDQKSPKTVSGKNNECSASAILNQMSVLDTRCSGSRNLLSNVEEDVENFTILAAPDTCKTVDTQLKEFTELQDLHSGRVDSDANNLNSGSYEDLFGSNDQKSDEFDHRQSQLDYSLEKSGVHDKYFKPQNLWSDGENQCLQYGTIDESIKECIEMTEAGIDEGIPVPSPNAHYRTSKSEANPDLKLASRTPLDYPAPGQPDEIPAKNAPSDEFRSIPCENPEGVMYEDVEPKDDDVTLMAFMLAPTAEGLETALVDYPDGTVKDVDGCMYMPHGQINMPEMPPDAQPCDIRLRTMPAAERHRMHYLEDQIMAAHVKILTDCGSGGTYAHLYQKLLEIKRLEDQYEKFMNDNLKF